MVTKRTSGLPLICLVCDDIARGINYDVMTCMSCKIFFRRHVLKSDIKLQCQFDNNCKITKRTRNICSACRLKKCFLLGMNQQLIRHWSYNQLKLKHSQLLKIKNKNENQLPKPLPLSLLNNDRSNLTNNEWNLLSNIIHAYDEANIIPQMKYCLVQQSSLPPKLRSKLSEATAIFRALLSSLQPFVERSLYFHNLSNDTRQALVQNNFEIAGTLNSVFIIREINALDNMTFVASCATFYGDKVVKQSFHLTSQLESNGILVKIMILILAFSTNTSIVNPYYSENIMSISSALTVFHIESILVTMFWKYLNYQYGYRGAVRCLNSLIRSILDILYSANEMRNEQHDNMVDMVVEETKRSLTIEN
ncbi:unnamed protein product [Rotaria sordida]|uniref:Nuclear receptor domain-containing protein n=1 Tax=Rotaria sordida TaxID=392033 RepID=A0A819Y9T7_9BILA|nr:unnamed protein product [Rotaria sordida]CAF4154760.1 unnamed protein product [Rotaria sordida]